MPKQNTRRPDKAKNEKESLPTPPVQSHKPKGSLQRRALRRCLTPDRASVAYSQARPVARDRDSLLVDVHTYQPDLLHWTSIP
jgi:hypothetical protein